LTDWPDNVWPGTSVEDQPVLHRADELRRVHANVRFLSLGRCWARCQNWI